jgi:hypothetical protein
MYGGVPYLSSKVSPPYLAIIVDIKIFLLITCNMALRKRYSLAIRVSVTHSWWSTSENTVKVEAIVTLRIHQLETLRHSRCLT